MMVGDIYGKNSNALEKLGLPSDVVASSFGKFKLLGSSHFMSFLFSHVPSFPPFPKAN